MSWIELVAQRRPPQVPEGMQPPENSGDWYRIENSAEDPDATDVYVYDSIGGWFGTTADDFIRDMREISTRNINLRLNSPGGSVFEGIAIANAIRTHPANVTVYVDGLAASIASVIALAGDRLVMMPQSQMMIHDASGGCYGNAADMEYMVGLLNKQSDNIADAYASRAGGTADEWRDLMRSETWYSAKEAVAAGLADEVREKPAADATEDALAARMQSVWNLTAYRYAGREKAPVPKIAASAVPKVEITIGGASVDVSDELMATLRRILPRPGGAVSDAAPVVEEPVEEKEPAVANAEADSSLLDAIRDMIRAEFAELKSALPPFLKPEEETEDAVEEEVDDASEEEVEDADKKKKKKLPPWLKPDEEEEDDDTEDASTEEVEDESEEPSTEASAAAGADDGASPSDTPVETGLGNAGDTVESQETYDEAFSGLIAHLMSPSPSADDVFNRLKEAL